MRMVARATAQRDRGIGISSGEAGAAVGEGVEIGGLGIFITVAAQSVGGIVLGGDPEDIGAVCCNCRKGNEEE